LSDISFNLAPGESLGVLGKNGAGKSTLLKLIAGVVQPTVGTIHVLGRVVALLELGMGFHPDFSGRQNAMIAARIMGLTSEELVHAVPEILGFSELGEFFDKPIRIYSTGMQMRLAFAVATAVRPDLLIVDEALVVGDAAFQRKCFRRIEDYRAAGMSLLFVSHDVETVKKICDRSICISDGKIAAIGDSKTVCDLYERSLFGTSSSGEYVHSSKISPATSSRFDPGLQTPHELIYGNGAADIVDFWLQDDAGDRANVFSVGSQLKWCYRVRFNQSVERPVFAMMIKTTEGVTLFGTDTAKLRVNAGGFNSGDEVTIDFDLQLRLTPGDYHLNCGVRSIFSGIDEFLVRRVDCAVFRVVDNNSTSAAVGMVDMGARINVQRH
jgi:lipopolysaccharide transport system ATP-binding protein